MNKLHCLQHVWLLEAEQGGVRRCSLNAVRVDAALECYLMSFVLRAALKVRWDASEEALDGFHAALLDLTCCLRGGQQMCIRVSRHGRASGAPRGA